MTGEMTPELQAFVAQVKARYPSIRPHSEDDSEWRDEGFGFKEQGHYAKAEAKFQQLLLSQPEHSDAYEGRALLYEKMGKKTEALMLIDHAIALAGGSLRTATWTSVSLMTCSGIGNAYGR